MTSELITEIEKLQRLLAYENAAINGKSAYVQERTVLPMIQNITENIKNLVHGESKNTIQQNSKFMDTALSPLYKLQKEMSLKSDNKKMIQLKSLMNARSCLNTKEKESDEGLLIQTENIEKPYNHSKKERLENTLPDYHSIDKFIKTRTIIGSETSFDEKKMQKLSRPKTTMNKNSLLKELDGIIKNKMQNLNGKKQERTSRKEKAISIPLKESQLGDNIDDTSRRRTGTLTYAHSKKKLMTNQTSKKTIEATTNAKFIESATDQHKISKSKENMDSEKRLAEFLKNGDSIQIEEDGSVIINNNFGNFKDMLGNSINIEENNINKNMDKHLNSNIDKNHLSLNNSKKNNDQENSDDNFAFNKNNELFSDVTPIDEHNQYLYNELDVKNSEPKPIIPNEIGSINFNQQGLFSEDEDKYLASKIDLKSSIEASKKQASVLNHRKTSYAQRRTDFNMDDFNDYADNKSSTNEKPNTPVHRRSSKNKNKSATLKSKNTGSKSNKNLGEDSLLKNLSNSSKISRAPRKKTNEVSNNDSRLKPINPNNKKDNEKTIDKTPTQKTDRLTAYKGLFSSKDLNNSLDDRLKQNNPKLITSARKEKTQNSQKRYTVGYNNEATPDINCVKNNDFEVNPNYNNNFQQKSKYMVSSSMKHENKHKNIKNKEENSNISNSKKYFLLKSRNNEDKNEFVETINKKGNTMGQKKRTSSITKEIQKFQELMSDSA